LFSAFMMGMWAVFPNKPHRPDKAEEAAAILPVDSVSVAQVSHRTRVAQGKPLITPVVNAVPHPNVIAAVQTPAQRDAGVTLQNCMYYDDFDQDDDSIW